MAVSALKTFRCRVRALALTTTIECVAPSAEAAAHAVVQHGFATDPARWIQVAVAEWSGVLGEFIDPANVIIVARGAPPPPGADRVVFSSVRSVRNDRFP